MWIVNILGNFEVLYLTWLALLGFQYITLASILYINWPWLLHPWASKVKDRSLSISPAPIFTVSLYSQVYTVLHTSLFSHPLQPRLHPPNDAFTGTYSCLLSSSQPDYTALELSCFAVITEVCHQIHGGRDIKNSKCMWHPRGTTHHQKQSQSWRQSAVIPSKPFISI